MKNLSRNTAAVLVITLFTALAVFSAVQLGGRLFGTSSASAQTIGAQAGQTQGQTGDDDGHGDGQGYGSQGTGGQSSSDPYGQSTSGTDGGQTYTCPATGCTASSCHATQ